MKILYVDTFGTLSASDNVKGLSRAYSAIGNMKGFNYRKIVQTKGVAEMNAILIREALEFRPQLVHLGKCESVKAATLEIIKRETDAFIIYYYGDFRWDMLPLIVALGKVADCTLFSHTDERILDLYRTLGVLRFEFLPMGVDTGIIHPCEVKREHSIVFFGGNYYKHQHFGPLYTGYKTRWELMQSFLEDGIDVHSYGKFWDKLAEKYSNFHIYSFVAGGQFALASSQAKITLGVNAVNGIELYVSWPRLLKCMASGAFHLTHYVPGLERLFENKKELVWFHSVEEALELARYYLEHDEEREMIASRGREKVLAEHTWNARVQSILTFMGGKGKG